MINFASNQLIKVLQELEKDSFSGIAEVTVEISQSGKKNSKILVFRESKLVFAAHKLFTPQELAVKMAKELNISIIDAALKTAETKVSNHHSFQEILSFLSRMKIITFQQIEAFVLQHIIVTLEHLLPYAGTIQTKSEIEFDLDYETQKNGWSLDELMLKLQERKQQWQKLKSVGINSIESIPKFKAENISKIGSIPAQKHCKNWIDGKRNIGEIAEKTEQDPLKLAKNYSIWVNQNWIYFQEVIPLPEPEKFLTEQILEPEKFLPTVLSVDDSPVVQTMLKRALSDRYEVLLANNGMDALKILNSSKQEIRLVLLDVTMPDIDGIELCRTIRRFKKFQDLPIIMLTAKDGMFDKVKGKFAGSTEYLTKPVDKEELLTTMAKYVPSLAIK